MSSPSLDIVIVGLSITSSWGNGHATTYRGLSYELSSRGHSVTFLERDVPWYSSNRDMPTLSGVNVRLYTSLEELMDTYTEVVKKADIVIVGSYVPDGVEVGDWVIKTAEGITAFYDIDTPVTLTCLANNSCTYLGAHQIPNYDIYLSFSGGPVLQMLQHVYGSPNAKPLYCSVDPLNYYPGPDTRYHLGYMGTYSDDRQPTLEKLLIEPARMWPEGEFIVAGPQYPESVEWPDNIRRIQHLPPSEHQRFYSSQRFTLNVTRADMIRAGYSPSVRLFEAAACATPVISDYWEGLEEFFTPGKDILISHSAQQTLMYLQQISEEEAYLIGRKARKRILSRHTAAHRAAELEHYVFESMRMVSA